MNEREWILEKAVEKVKPNMMRGELSKNFNLSPKPILEDHEVTDEMLNESYYIMARIVRSHGNQYLPIFKRLQAEIEERMENKKLLEIAIKMSTK